MAIMPPEAPRVRLAELDSSEALELLAGVAYGRVVFTESALPAIRPVNHLVDQGRIVIRTRMTSTFAAAVNATPTVVAYQADRLDPVQRLGWSVVVTGLAAPITDPAEIERLERVLIPWVAMDLDTMLAISPRIVSGFRLTHG
jgi:nitroimidazol reductase NimA-like FMN-containing flavoprotein (pyridoxamine 5'-phosphate oxidase superfamily)